MWREGYRDGRVLVRQRLFLRRLLCLCLCLCLAGFACAYQYVCACACVPLGEDGFGRGGKDRKRFRLALGCIGPDYYYYYQAGHCMSRPPAVLFSGL